jgi:hypothetical protein
MPFGRLVGKMPNACRSGALMDPVMPNPSLPDDRAAFFPDPFPLPWASDWGEDDEYGLWMALTLAKRARSSAGSRRAAS